MKNRKITLACLVAVSAFAVASCTKKIGESVHDRLVGSWRIDLEGIDANGNGTIDASETQITPDHPYFRFSGDGVCWHEDSAVYYTFHWNDPTFHWTLTNNDADLVLVPWSSNTSYTYHIARLTSTDLTLVATDTSKTILVMNKER
jgi:hypothetical protein